MSEIILFFIDPRFFSLDSTKEDNSTMTEFVAYVNKNEDCF